jgi:uncharacterized protein DUF4384
MKIITRLVIAVLLISSVSAFAQKSQKNDQTNEARTRDLFVKKRADAMNIILLKVDGASLVPVSPSQEFKEGDQVKVAFESNFQGYVYLVNVTPGGKKKILFPATAESVNSVQANKQYTFPPGNDIIEFDKEKGTEVLQVIMSRERVPLLEEALKNSEGILGESAKSAAAELQSGIVGDKVTSVLPKESGRGGIRSRDVIIAAGQDKDPAGSVVAIPETKGKGGKVEAGRLESGQVAVFEVRLKHN